MQWWRMYFGFNNINFNSQGSAAANTLLAIVYFFVICIITQILRWLFRLLIESFSSSTGFKTKSSLITSKMLIKVAAYAAFLVFTASIFSEYLSFRQKSWDEITIVLTLFITFCMIIQTLTSLIQPGKLLQNIKLWLFYSDETV